MNHQAADLAPHPAATWIVLLCAIAVSAHAQSVEEPWGAESGARGGAVAADTLVIWSAAVNPAIAAGWQAPESRVSVALPTLRAAPMRSSLIAAVPLGPCVAIAGVTSTGIAQFRETVIAIAAAATVAPDIAVGVAAGMHTVAIDHYGSASAFTFGCGARLALLPQLAAGISAANVTGARIGQGRDALPREIRFGIALVPHPMLALTVDVVGRAGESGSLCVGARAIVTDAFALLCGFSTEPSSLAVGVELNLPFASVSYSYRALPEVGGTQTLSAGVKL